MLLLHRSLTFAQWRSGNPSPAQLRKLAHKRLLGDYADNVTSPAWIMPFRQISATHYG